MQRGDLGTYADVEADVLHGRALLWINAEGMRITAAAVTQVSRTECSKVCTIVACGGTGGWGGISKIEEYAKAEGCDCIRIFGRKGWQRVLKDYRAARIVLERKL